MSQDWFTQYSWLFVLIALWELLWKGWALWIAARKDDRAWFIILLIINTIGLLPLAYIFIFSKRPAHTQTEQ